jgi:predicted dithiol-disulfide oxidoreductase (DUF899 family)
MELPEIVGAADWKRANDELIAREKEAMRASDALAAERRRQPMTEVSTGYEFEGPDGRVGLLDLFEGRRQLILYHFWFPPGGPPCSGCSMFTDQVGHPAHIAARDTTIALASTASQPEIEQFRARMGWELPWYTPVGSEFQEACETTEYFALEVYLRDGDRAFLTYKTRGRGVEPLGSVWTFLDRTPLGRQEKWEDTPPGRPQTPPYQWWQLHDEYEHSAKP